mgnify:FL=1
MEDKKWEDYDTIKCPNGQIIDMQALLAEQQNAKVALIRLMPWLGGFIGRLRFVYTFRVQTQATDGYNLFVNPQFTYNLNLLQKTFVLAHEVMHCLLNHLRRAQGRGDDMNRANVAADYEANITLADVPPFSVSMIKDMQALIDEKYRKMSYEEIYDKVSKSNDSQQNQQGEKDAQKNNRYSSDYKAGWNQAMKDYKEGKISV